jgi:hypothetical protein
MTSTQEPQGSVTRSISEDEAARTGIDTTVPHSARVWNYVLGGKDNYAVDRAAGDGMIAALPSIVAVARAYRQFIARSAQVALEAGCRQFLDVGTGLPTANSTHLLVQAQAPEAKVVYVDNDPLVLVHAKALLTSTPEGKTDYIDADMHDPERIIEEACRTLDLSQPVMVTFTGVLGHAKDAAQAADICNRLMAPGPPTRTTTLAGSPTTSAPRRRSQRSSTAWSWWSPGSSRSTDGAPTTSRSAPLGSPLPPSPGSPASPS